MTRFLRPNSSAGLRLATSIALLFLLMPQVPLQSLLHVGQASQQQPEIGSTTGGELPLQHGQPLPPGTVSYSNSWAGLQPDACVLPSAPTTEKPSPVAGNGSATISVNLPRDLFMGTPGAYLVQAYTFFANGTLSVKDSEGNSLSMRPVGGLPAGKVTTALRANSTAAFEEYLVTTAGGKTLANVTVAYAVRYQDCQPAGLGVTIGGTADWGQASGTLKAVLSRAPSSIAGDHATFGNSSSWASLAFDWSDSASLSPVWDPKGDSVSWTVGSSFTVDPEIVATSNSGAATSDVGGLKECSASGRSWAWYYNGASVGFTSSAGGGNWSAFTSVLAASGGGSFAIYCSGPNVYYAIAGPGTVSFGDGTMNADGTVSWGGNGSFATTHPGGATGAPATVIDSSGNWWITVTTSGNGGERYVEVWRLYCPVVDSCSWNEWKDIDTGSNEPGTTGSVLSLKSGVGVIWGAPGGTVSVVTSADEGITWSAAVSTSGSCRSLRDSQFTSSGDSVTGACDETSGRDTFLKFAWGGGSWTETSLSSDNYTQTPISSDGSRTFVAFEADEDSPDIYYFVSTDQGATWGPRQTLATDESSLQPFSATAGPISDSIVALEWTDGTSAPYDVRFASFPPVVPDAAVSANSWSKPGLSPYESYFQQTTQYVSPGNGLLTVEQDDLYLPGRGLDLTIGRVFSTPYGFRSESPYEYDNYTGANLGNGWSLNFPWLGANYLHLADGETYPYRWTGNTFQVNNATNFELVHNGDGSYDLFFASGTDYHFGANKSLLTVTDTTGKNVISFSYSAGRISHIEDTIGRIVTFSYNANGQLASISSGGRTWTYGYLGNDLVSATDPLGRITRYEYNDGINRWLLTGIIYPTLGGATYAYGSAPVGTEVTTNYVTQTNVYWSPSLASLSESVSTSYKITNGQVSWANATTADGSGNVQCYEDTNFQTSKALTRVYDKDSSGAVVRVTETDYDSSGRVNQTKTISPSGTLLASSQTAYDDWGNPTYTSDDLGHQEYFSYANTNSQDTFNVSGFSNSFYPSPTISPNIHDALIGEAQFQNGPNTAPQEEYFEYDSAGNLLQTKQPHDAGWLLTDNTYDIYGNVLSTTDALGRTTYFEYSSTYSSAYLTEQITPVGAQNVTTSYTYDPATGNQLTMTDADGFTTTYQYDALGRLTLTTYPAVSGVVASVRYLYYDADNVLTTINENGAVTKQYYDGLGRMTEVVRYNGDAVYSSESYTYNWDNQVATMTTATGSTYTYTYDSFGRLVKTVNPDGTSSTTSYDDVNDTQTVTDENGHQTQDDYDLDGRLTAVREYYTPTAYYLTTYTYDQSENLLAQRDPNGATTSYQYDDLNRLTTTTYPDGTSESLSYDAVGNLVSRTEPDGNTITYSYDAFERLTKVTYPNSSAVTYTYDNDGNVLSTVNAGSSDYYTYDARGRVTNQTEVIAGSAYQVLYRYDAASNILSVKYPDGSTSTFTYDALGRVSSVNGGAERFTYTLDDKISTITYADGAVTAYSYDSMDRPTSIAATQAETKVLDLNYTYDPAGNVLSVNNESYTYDALNRVASAKGPWGLMTYAYDGAGNLVSLTTNAATTAYGYGSYNRLTSVGSATLSYDADGNLVKLVNGSTAWAYSYDYENRLTGVSKNDITVETNVYDSGGQRVESVQGSAATVYVYEGSDLIYQKDLNNGTVDKFYYANGLMLEEATGTGALYYHLDDALGSTRVVLQGTSNTVFSSDYKPFGQSYGQKGSSQFQYGGKQLDLSTGLYYFGARFYDPAVQRFITEDSSAGSPTDPQSLDRYVYARDNPLAITDPTGHSWFGSIASALSNAAGKVEAGASGLASAAVNTWESLPPPVQVGVVAAASVAAVALRASPKNQYFSPI